MQLIHSNTETGTDHPTVDFAPAHRLHHTAYATLRSCEGDVDEAAKLLSNLLASDGELRHALAEYVIGIRLDLEAANTLIAGMRKTQERLLADLTFAEMNGDRQTEAALNAQLQRLNDSVRFEDDCWSPRNVRDKHNVEDAKQLLAYSLKEHKALCEKITAHNIACALEDAITLTKLLEVNGELCISAMQFFIELELYNEEAGATLLSVLLKDGGNIEHFDADDIAIL
jgi:hypothetical protein